MLESAVCGGIANTIGSKRAGQYTVLLISIYCVDLYARKGSLNCRWFLDQVGPDWFADNNDERVAGFEFSS